MWNGSNTFLLSSVRLTKSPQCRVTQWFGQAKKTVGDPIDGNFQTESTMFRWRLCNSFQSSIWLSHEYPHFGKTEVRAKWILSLKGRCNLDNWRNRWVASWSLFSAITFAWFSSIYRKKDPRLLAEVTGFGRLSTCSLSKSSRFEAQDQLFCMSNVISISGRIGRIFVELQLNHYDVCGVFPSCQQRQ